MKKKLLLLFLALLFIGLANANAATFESGSGNYYLEDLNSTCVQTYINNAIPAGLVGDKVLFTDANYEEFILVSQDGTCSSNVTMEMANNAREKLNNLGIFLQEKDGKNYATREKYSIAIKLFTEKDSGNPIELSHYDRETIEDGFTYYKREESGGVTYAVKVAEEDLKQNDIFKYYYENPGVHEVQKEVITEVNSSMTNFVNTKGGSFVKFPKKNRVFAYALDDADKIMVYSDENYIIFSALDAFEIIEEYVFFTIENGVGKVRNATATFHTINNLESVRVVDENDFYILIETVDTSGNAKAMLLSNYKVSDDQTSVYPGGDFKIKFKNDLSDLNNLTLDGNNVDPSMYTVNTTTGELTIKEEYLDNQSVGSHELKLGYSNGIEVTYTFYIFKNISVTFDANGGIFSNSSDKLIYDEWFPNYIDYLVKPTREGYVFKGFYTEKEGGISLQEYNEAGIDQDMTFYARWEAQNIKNPKTFDGIISSIIIGLTSLIGLFLITKKLKTLN